MARVYVLGSGTPTPTPQRFGSSFVAEFGDYQVMIDCGPAATHKLVKAGLWPTNIDHLFFTHHHFDHDIDYPCFLLYYLVLRLRQMLVLTWFFSGQL